MANFVRCLGAGRFCVAALLAGVLSGCGANNRPVVVFIDNAGEQPMVVSVNDQEAATIEAGEVAKLNFPPGEYRFVVRSGDETVCDVVRKLEPSERWGISRKYLFDPLKGNRYHIYTAQYGTNRLEGVMESTLLQFQKDPVIRRQYVYKQLLKEITILPDDAWNDVTEVQYVLTPPPEVVYSKRTVRHKVLDRIEIRYCDWLDRMAKIERPSDEDIDSLNELIDEILAEAL